MRTLYLHIGLHKTGTTFLQKLLLENRDRLLRAGLGLGPYQDPELGTHHPIIAAMRRLGAERVMAEAARCAGDALLVSAEDLCHLLDDPARARALRDAAARHFDVRIIIFLRRQDRLAESYYAESVKTWHTGPIGMAGLDGRPWIYDLDHEARLARLESVFGRDRITVRLYSDAGRNDLAAALLSATGLDAAALGLRTVRPLNVALHRRKVLFLSQVPKPDRDEECPRARFPIRFLRRVVAESEAIADDGLRHMLPPELRRALVARHRDGNRRVAERYGLPLDTGLLDLPGSGGRDADWAPPAPITRGEFLGILGDAYRAARASARPRSAIANAARMSLLLGATLPRLRPVRGEARPARLVPAE